MNASMPSAASVEQVAGHGLAGQRVGIGQPAVDLPVERALAERDDARALRQDDSRRTRATSASSSAGGHDAVDESPGQRGRGVDQLAGQQHFHRALARDVAATPTAGRRAEEADVDARQREARVVAATARSHIDDQLAAGGGGDAVHAGDHRLRQSRAASASSGCSCRRARAARRRRDARASPSGRARRRIRGPAPARTTTRTAGVRRDRVELGCRARRSSRATAH